MGELLRLLHAARRSGVLGQIMDSMAVGEQPGAMNDATKRRKDVPEELSSDSEWDAMVGRSSDSPAVDNQARYVTEGDTVIDKPNQERERWNEQCCEDSRYFPYVRHIDESIAIPVREWLISKEWSRDHRSDGQVCRFELVLLRTHSSF